MLHSRPTASQFDNLVGDKSVPKELQKDHIHSVLCQASVCRISALYFFELHRNKEPTDKAFQGPQENTKIPNVQPRTILFFVTLVAWDKTTNAASVALPWLGGIIVMLTFVFISHVSLWQQDRILWVSSNIQTASTLCGVKQSCSLNSKVYFFDSLSELVTDVFHTWEIAPITTSIEHHGSLRVKKYFDKQDLAWTDISNWTRVSIFIAV